MADNVYVYAIAKADTALTDGQVASQLPAVDNVTAQPVWRQIGDIFVAVSPIAAEQLMSMRRHLLAHTKILEALMEERTILPMRFGLIASFEEVEALVHAESGQFKAHLAELEGKVEYGVTVSWKREAAMSELVWENPMLRRRYEALQGRSEAETHHERLDLGRDVELALSAKRDAERERLALGLKDLAEQSVIQDPADDMVVLKGAFLVNRDKGEALFEALRKLADEQNDRVDVKFIGPAPVYNFVDVRLTRAPAQKAS